MSNFFRFNDDLCQELKRKSFHLLGLVYPLTLHWIGLTDFRILLIVFWVVVALMEFTRLSVSSSNGFVFEHFGDLFREKERNRPMGVFWMLSGVLFVTFLLDQPALITTTLLYVVFGDMAASLVGKWVGGPKWFRSEKRLSGSLACFVACIGIGYLILRADNLYLVFGGALIATLAEIGIAKLDDNFTVPLFSALFMFCFS